MEVNDGLPGTGMGPAIGTKLFARVCVAALLGAVNGCPAASEPSANTHECDEDEAGPIAPGDSAS